MKAFWDQIANQNVFLNFLKVGQTSKLSSKLINKGMGSFFSFFHYRIQYTVKMHLLTLKIRQFEHTYSRTYSCMFVFEVSNFGLIQLRGGTSSNHDKKMLSRSFNQETVK